MVVEMLEGWIRNPSGQIVLKKFLKQLLRLSLSDSVVLKLGEVRYGVTQDVEPGAR